VRLPVDRRPAVAACARVADVNFLSATCDRADQEAKLRVQARKADQEAAEAAAIAQAKANAVAAAAEAKAKADAAAKAQADEKARLRRIKLAEKSAKERANAEATGDNDVLLFKFMGAVLFCAAVFAAVIMYIISDSYSASQMRKKGYQQIGQGICVPRIIR